jgi:hypothetical protein
MPGPPPKPAGERRRRNAVAPVVTLPPKSHRRAPALPSGGKRKFLKATRDWWATIWASPMAAVWLPADVPALIRLAHLIDQANRGEASTMVLAEIRQLEDRFGLSPMARRRLQWEVSRAAAPADEGEKPVEPKRNDDRFLRVVS